MRSIPSTQAGSEKQSAEMSVQQIFWRSVALVLRAAPRELINLLLLNLVRGGRSFDCTLFWQSCN